MIKQSVASKVPVRLLDLTGDGKVGIDSTTIDTTHGITIIKSDGTVVDITVVDMGGSQNWFEVSPSRAPGLYHLLIPSSATNLLGTIQWIIRPQSAMDFVPSINSTTVESYPTTITSISSDTTAIKAKTDLIGTSSVASTSDVTSARDSIKGGQDVNSVYTRLGAPVGVSASADIAAVKSDTNTIKAKTNNLPSDPASSTNVTAAITSIKGTQNLSISTIAGGADFSSGADNLHAISSAVGTLTAEEASNVWDALRSSHITTGTFGEAIRVLYQAARGHIKIDKFLNQLIVYEEDNTTPLYSCDLKKDGSPANIYANERLAGS